MGAYNDPGTALAGLKASIDSRVRTYRCAETEGIAAGVAVFGHEGNSIDAYKYQLEVGKIVFDADFVTANSIVLTIQGTALDAVVFATDHDTTMDLLVAAVDAAGYVGALDSGDVNNRTLFITTYGETAVVAEAVTGGDSQPDGTITYQDADDLVFLGVTMLTQKEYAGATSLYEYNDAMNVMVDGDVWVTTGEAVLAGEDAYIRTTDGLFGDSGIDISSVCRYVEGVAAAGLALAHVSGQLDV
jgi:hypothetical protein